MATKDDLPKAPTAKPAAKPAAKRGSSAKKVAAPATAKAKPAAAKTTAKPVAQRAQAIKGEAQNVLGKVKAGARDAANSGKEKATSTLNDVSAMVENVANALDERVGAQYGDYARKAADAVTGIADTLKSKEVDELLNDARNFVRQRPAVAIGAAAALGFVLTRVFRAGDDTDA